MLFNQSIIYYLITFVFEKYFLKYLEKKYIYIVLQLIMSISNRISFS